jgi:hypothetical protein
MRFGSAVVKAVTVTPPPPPERHKKQKAAAATDDTDTQLDVIFFLSSILPL